MYRKFLIILVIFIHQVTIAEQRFSFSKEYDLESSLNKEYDFETEIKMLKQESFIAISLGENCFPALHLREHGIRIRSFPFDWNITPFEALYSLIENDFDGFLEFNNLAINKKENTMYSTRYNFKLNHDFDIAEWEEDSTGIIPKDDYVLEKYKKTLAYYHRRITRFYYVFTLDVPIYLFRRVISSSQAKKLYNLLKNKFPQSNFTLICIQDEQWESPEKWENLPDIIYIRMERSEGYKLEHRNTIWTNLLSKLGFC